MPIIRFHALAALLVALLLLLLAASGCGKERSTEAYCNAYHSGFNKLKKQYPDVDQYSTTKENPLVLLLRTTSALGDVVALIGDMESVAPDDIESDTKRVHDSMQKQLDMVGGTGGAAAGGNLAGALEGLGSAFMDSITNAGAYDRMDKYIVSNCGGEHMFAASPQR